jgi:hypothetical protein
MTQARRWLAATGLLPFAKRAARLYVGLRPKRLGHYGGSDGQVYDSCALMAMRSDAFSVISAGTIPNCSRLLRAPP